MFALTTKILIVDDMLTMRKLVRKGLMGMGFTEFEDAEDGTKAWEKLQIFSDVGLVISDWNMPQCTGLDLLKKVRGDAKLKNLPFILLTAEGEAHQVKEALSVKVDGYVLKPFTPESLKLQLEKTASKRQVA